MAVIPGSERLHWTGSTGKAAMPGTAEYVAVWRLKTDDPLDQSKTVLEYFQANVVFLGAPYFYGNDTASGNAFAQNIAADRNLPSLVDWEVVVDYGPPEEQDQEQRDENGNPTDDPTKWRPRIAFGTVQYRRPVEGAQYVSGYGATFEDRYPAAGTHRIIPMNSAFVPFVNPPAEEDASRSWMMIGGNFPVVDEQGDPLPVDVDEIDTYENWVNTVAFKVTHRGITKDFAIRQAKIRQIKIEPKTYSGFDYVAIDWYFDKAVRRWTAGGGAVTNWDSYILDRGNHQRALAGDPDGKGGVVDQSPPGTPAITPAKSPLGEIIVEDVLFDGDGKPLDMEVTPAPDEVYGQWRHYQETDFLQLEYLKTLIEAVA